MLTQQAEMGLKPTCGMCRHFVTVRGDRTDYCNARTTLKIYEDKTLEQKLERHHMTDASTCVVFDEVTPF